VISDPLGDAVAWIRQGGLLCYPTETVWGLGADARSERAVARLRHWKSRGEDQPLSLLVEGIEALETLGIDPGPEARSLARQFWPGPLTLVVPSRAAFARGVARQDGAIGLRCTAHPLASALARRLRKEGVGPVTATSLNRGGAPPARTRAEARAVCGERDEEPRMLEVEGAEAGGDRESTIVDLTGPRHRVLRWGALPQAVLAPVLEEFDRQ
jgi:L-threonylcarbamoyladenylate synthase